MAQHHSGTDAAHQPPPQHIIPGHDTITLAYGKIAPADWAWDDDNGDGILLIGDHLPDDRIGAVIQAALERRRLAG